MLEDINLYPLNYVHKDDWITDKYGSALVPFYYFKELQAAERSATYRRQKFQELVPVPNVASR